MKNNAFLPLLLYSIIWFCVTSCVEKDQFNSTQLEEEIMTFIDEVKVYEELTLEGDLSPSIIIVEFYIEDGAKFIRFYNLPYFRYKNVDLAKIIDEHLIVFYVESQDVFREFYPDWKEFDREILKNFADENVPGAGDSEMENITRIYQVKMNPEMIRIK